MSKRRLIEWGKNILILLLSVSAIYLLAMTPLVQDSGLANLFSGRKDREVSSGVVVLTSAAHPSRMAVMGLNGRYGVQYDQETVDSLFARWGPLLGEGLATAASPETITEAQWQLALAKTGVYFDFDRSIPLSALSSWLYPEGECVLEGSARRILLSAGEDDLVILQYQDGESGLFYACETELSRSLHLDPLVADVESNDAHFAYESEELANLLQPYTLVTEADNGQVYAVSNPLTQTEGINSLLKALSFNSENRVSVSEGDAYLDGGARLEVSDDGKVVYSDGHEAKYPVAAAEEQATVAELIETARELAEMTLGAHCGDAELYLESVRETESGWRIRFGYRLNGSAVWLYEEGWAAEFLIREDCVSEFTLCFRAYTAMGNEVLLLPIDRAAVILPGLTDEVKELVVQYRDRGGNEVVPGWVAQ